MRKSHLIMQYTAFLLFSFLLLPMGRRDDVHSSENNSTAKVPNEQTNLSQKMVFVLPLSEGKVTARFGPMKHPFTKKIVHHRGIDIATKKGTDVYAAADGSVLSVISEYEINKGSGKKIVLQHSDVYQTQYTHLDTIYVKEGQQVKAGERIAGVGSTGLSTGPHLHFEIWENGEAQDPEKYLDFKALKRASK